MKKKNLTFQLLITLLAAMLLTVSTIGCGKSGIKKNSNNSKSNDIEKFSTAFFTECNLPYQKLNRSDVQNTPEEYLFYINDGVVYRTLNDYGVVLVRREYLKEEGERRTTDYSGELYRLFQEDDVDCLKISASGNYALLALPASIPDWENDTVITLFMNYAKNYSDSGQ